MKRTPNEAVLLSILEQLNVCKAKRSVLTSRSLETDKLDMRIKELEVAKEMHEAMMLKAENERLGIADRKLRDEMGMK